MVINKASAKQRVKHELIEYGVNVVYLTLVFATFTNYKRLVLAAHDIVYTDYWVALIQALILGKVIMIGGLFGLGRGLESKPLIYPTLYKTLVFTLFVAAFKVIENTITGLISGEGFAAGLAELSGQGYLLLANSLVILIAFIPFFGIKELARVWGDKQLMALFFSRNQH